MLRADNLQFRRGQEVLFEHLDFIVHPGQRVAIAGRNGVGKSTLFQLILGELEIDDGELEVPTQWVVGHMEQEAEVTDRPALEYVVDGHQQLRKVEEALAHTQEPNKLAQLHADFQDLGGYEAHAKAGEILSGLGFSSEDTNKPYREFSGGWRIRLNLAKALMTPCDLLLLDEPTNHLDFQSENILIQALQQYEGTYVVVSHNRHFVSKVANKIWYIEDHEIKEYSGSYDEYVYWKDNQKVEAPKAVEKPAEPKRTKQTSSKPRPQSDKVEKLKKEVSQLEKEITELESELNSAEEELAKPEVFSNPDELQSKNEAYQKVKSNLDKKNDLWEAKMVEIESLESNS
jgi:ATP-binding cassette subfamily F protein 3